MTGPTFILHPTLERDSVPILDRDGIIVRLIHDERYPWIIVVPKLPNLSDMHDMDVSTYTRVLDLVRTTSQKMSETFGADKMNVAAIGNMVPQLHIHIVARYKNDQAWPNPIWGVGAPEPLDPKTKSERLNKLVEIFQSIG